MNRPRNSSFALPSLTRVLRAVVARFLIPSDRMVAFQVGLRVVFLVALMEFANLSTPTLVHIVVLDAHRAKESSRCLAQFQCERLLLVSKRNAQKSLPLTTAKKRCNTVWQCNVHLPRYCAALAMQLSEATQAENWCKILTV